MPLTLAQLLATPTKEELRARLLRLLQGIGLTTHSGYSPGTVYGQGTPIASYAAAVLITYTDVSFKLSDDGGQTWGPERLMPPEAIGVYTLASNDPLYGSGLTSIVFVRQPTGYSFLVDDVFSFELSSPGLPTTSWQEGDPELTLAEMDADALEDLYLLQQKIAAGGLLFDSFGDWLDLLAHEVYGIDRIEGVVAEGVLTLSDPHNQGPFTLNNGDLWVISDDGHRYVLAQNVTVGLAGSIDGVVFRAESKGSAYNVGNNTISTLVTAVPGLAVNNPDPGSGSWVTTPGSDDEADLVLQTRCAERWAELGVGLPGSNYDLWARAADASVTRVGTRVSPTVPGQVDVAVGGASGAVSGAVVTAVQDYIDPRVALTNTAEVSSAANVAVTVDGTVYVQAAYLAEATAAVQSALTALFLSKSISGDTLYLAELIEAIMVPRGVRNVVLTLPTGDTILTFGQLPTLTNSLTFVPV